MNLCKNVQYNVEALEARKRAILNLWHELPQGNGCNFCLALCCHFLSSQVFGLTPACWLSCKGVKSQHCPTANRNGRHALWEGNLCQGWVPVIKVCIWTQDWPQVWVVKQAGMWHSSLRAPIGHVFGGRIEVEINISCCDWLMTAVLPG